MQTNTDKSRTGPGTLLYFCNVITKQCLYVQLKKQMNHVTQVQINRTSQFG